MEGPLPLGSNHICKRKASTHAFPPHQADKTAAKKGCKKAPNPSNHFQLIRGVPSRGSTHCIRYNGSLATRTQSAATPEDGQPKPGQTRHQRRRRTFAKRPDKGRATIKKRAARSKAPPRPSDTRSQGTRQRTASWQRHDGRDPQDRMTGGQREQGSRSHHTKWGLVFPHDPMSAPTHELMP